MFEHLLRVAKGYLQRFLAVSARGAKAICDSFGSKNDAETRGLMLLSEWLSPEQLAQYHATGYFDVTGGDSGKRYRVHYGTSMNVQELDDAGHPRVGWCFVPNTYLVAGDVMLTGVFHLSWTGMTIPVVSEICSAAGIKRPKPLHAVSDRVAGRWAVRHRRGR
jgi:hypothetical protein